MDYEKLDIRKAMRTPPPPMDYVLPGLPCQCLGALVAPGGTGKSSLVTQISVEMALGLPLLGGIHDAKDPAKVVLLLAEEDERLCWMRLHALRSLIRGEAEDISTEMLSLLESNLTLLPLAGADVKVFSENRTTKFTDELNRRAEGARLLVIDPLRRFYDGDENDSGIMTSVINAFEAISRESGTTIVMTHHATKSSAIDGRSDTQQAARGSSAFSDGVRWQANLAFQGAVPSGAQEKKGTIDQTYRLVISKSNYAPPQSGGIELKRVANGLFKPHYISSANKRT